MKFLFVSGSRNPEGQTARALHAVIRGLQQSGEDGELIFLPALNIERCRQCDDKGWGICRTEGRCIIEDDFADVMDKVRHADLVVFATPVYYGDLSESFRAFTDRMRRTCGREIHQGDTKNKPAAGICVAGGGGGGAASCCVSLEKVISRCGFDIIDLIPIRRQNLEIKLPMLEMTGKWLATLPHSKPRMDRQSL